MMRIIFHKTFFLQSDFLQIVSTTKLYIYIYRKLYIDSKYPAKIFVNFKPNDVDKYDMMCEKNVRIERVE